MYAFDLKLFILRLLNVAFTGGKKVPELWNVGVDWTLWSTIICHVHGTKAIVEFGVFFLAIQYRP